VTKLDQHSHNYCSLHAMHVCAERFPTSAQKTLNSAKNEI